MTDLSGGKAYSSSFKTILVKFLEANGDMEQMPKKFRAALKCFVLQSKPNFLITDGNFFLTGHFTKQALENYKKSKPKFQLEDLRGFLININKWRVELAQVDSSKCFTSYANLEMRLMIEDFVVASETQQELENKNPANLFRDYECRAYLSAFMYLQQQTALKAKSIDWDSTQSVTLDGAATEQTFKDYAFDKKKGATVKKSAAKQVKAPSVQKLEAVAPPAKKVLIKKKTTI